MAFQAPQLHSSFLICFLLPLLSAILASGQSECNINLNSALSAGGSSPTSWTSHSGEFAFGFRPLQRSVSNNRDLFLLAIWFNRIPEQTIVWSRNDHAVPKGSQIQLTSEGHLILINPGGGEIYERPTPCAAMLDSGNFVLINGDSRYAWESFNAPTDIFSPGQRLGRNGNLTSRQSEVNYTNGRFQLRMQGDENLVLYTISLPTEVVNSPYWASNTVRDNSSSELVFDEAGYIYVEDENENENEKENVRNITIRAMGSSQDFYHMARINYDGVFRHYNHPRQSYVAAASGCSSAWDIVQSIPEDMCAIRGDLGSGACGYNSYCKNTDGRPACFCPEGY